MIDDVLAAIATSPWALPALFGLVLSDSLLVVVPGETAVTAFAALSVVLGQPSLIGVVAVAAFAAFTGDVLCYMIGRKVGLDRWAWMRGPRVSSALRWARRRLDRGTASVLFTARFIPFARLAVNLTAGASRFPAPRYLLFVSLAALVWAIYQAFIGAAVAQLLPRAPLIAVLVSIVVALLAGAALDLVLSRRWRANGNAAADPNTESEAPDA